MSDMAEETVALMLQVTKSFVTAPAAEVMRYSLDAAKGVAKATAKGTAKGVAKGASAMAEHMDGHGKTGEVSMRVLTREFGDEELVSLPIPTDELEHARELLHGYGVTFAVMQNPDTEQYSLHFRAKSADTVASALSHVVTQLDREREEEIEGPQKATDAKLSTENAETQRIVLAQPIALEWHDIDQGDDTVASWAEHEDYFVTANSMGEIEVSQFDPETSSFTPIIEDTAPFASIDRAKSYARASTGVCVDYRRRGMNINNPHPKKAEQKLSTKEVFKDARERATKRNLEAIQSKSATRGMAHAKSVPTR